MDMPQEMAETERIGRYIANKYSGAVSMSMSSCGNDGLPRLKSYSCPGTSYAAFGQSSLALLAR